MDMLKEKPNLLYIYEIVQIDKDLPKLKIDDPEWYFKNISITEDANKDKEFYKFICTLRRAFVRNMQEKINEYSKGDMMLAYCESKPNLSTRLEFKTIMKTVYVKEPSWFKQIWQYITKGKVYDDFLEKKLAKSIGTKGSVGTKGSKGIDSDELVSLEDFLNCNDEQEIENLRGTGFFKK